MIKSNDIDLQTIHWDKIIEEADNLFNELFPLCRSITGDGVRQTLRTLNHIAPFNIREIPSNTICYDWVVPEEWNITDAYIMDSKGTKVVDFKINNLHVVNYSIPIDKKLPFNELNNHLHYLPDMPNAIPYRTSYYNENWGFCLTYEQYQRLNRNEEYHAFIDSTLSNGHLTYGEGIINGTSGKEYLISTYCCHPSLANDNLSGPILWILLWRELSKIKTKHSYRFIIVPETIGAIAYLSENENAMKKIDGGFIPTTVAGPGGFGYKQSFKGNHIIDRVVKNTFKELNVPFIEYPFCINGSDESHYSAPYFRIPIGTICKDKYYEYDYYHTSLDNLEFVSARSLVESLKLYMLAIEKLEINSVYKSTNPYCEVMLGKRNLYPKIGGHIKQKAVNLEQSHSKWEYEISTDNFIFGDELDAIGWLMFYADGYTSLLDISEKTNIPMKQLYDVSKKLEENGLLIPQNLTKEII